MRRLALIALVLFAGCGFHHEKSYCFLPEGCTVHHRHYDAGDVIR